MRPRAANLKSPYGASDSDTSTSESARDMKTIGPKRTRIPLPWQSERPWAAAHGQPSQAEAGTRPPRGRAYPSGEYSRLKTAPWVRVLRYTESAGWMEA